MYDEVGPDTLALSTQLTIDAHDRAKERQAERDRLALSTQLTVSAHLATPGGSGPVPGCDTCTPHGCRQLEWAQRTAAELAQGSPIR